METEADIFAAGRTYGHEAAIGMVVRALAHAYSEDGWEALNELHLYMLQVQDIRLGGKNEEIQNAMLDSHRNKKENQNA